MDVQAIGAALAENQSKITAIQTQISAHVAKFQEQLAAAEEYSNQLRKAMLEALENSDDPSRGYEDDNIKITYVKPSQRTSVDTARLQFEHPDLFEKYKKVTKVKGSIRIKVK